MDYWADNYDWVCGCYSTRQDDLVVIHVISEYSSVIESPFKTELLVTLFKRYRNLTNQNLSLEFNDVSVSADIRLFCIFFLHCTSISTLSSRLDCLSDFQARQFLLVFTRESSYCFQRVLAIEILSVRLSVCPSVTRVDQSKTVQARITQSSPSLPGRL